MKSDTHYVKVDALAWACPTTEKKTDAARRYSNGKGLSTRADNGSRFRMSDQVTPRRVNVAPNWTGRPKAVGSI